MSKYEKLFLKASEVAKNAYAPYSGFKVGAALLAKDGRIFLGTNVENISYGGTLCAERNAFAGAVAEGARDFEAIAVYGGGGEAWPCGICRQFMHEFGEDLIVVTGSSAENLREVSLKELLPKAFEIRR